MIGRLRVYLGLSMDIGESWAYRARRADPLVEVRVLKVGTKKPARVLVRFLGEEFEGREEWVPPARLKTPWASVDEFTAREERWDAVCSASPVRDTAAEGASVSLFEELIDDDLASFGFNSTAGVTTIRDPEGLARFLGLGVEELRADPLSFEENGALIVPWSVTEVISKQAAQQYADRILRMVDEEEEQQRQERIHGRWYPGRGRSEGSYIPPEIRAEVDDEIGRPRRELLRHWCGAEAADRMEEVKELRAEVRRLGGLIEEAVRVLHRIGAPEAGRIERDLGVPVEQLATARQHHQIKRFARGG